MSSSSSLFAAGNRWQPTTEVHPSGFVIRDIAFNASMDAWIVLGTAMVSSLSSIAAVFLPDVQQNAAQDFVRSAQVQNFPCSSYGESLSRAATSCCLQDVAARYSVGGTFPVPRDGQPCSYLDPPRVDAADYSMSGRFAKLGRSEVQLLPALPGQDSLASELRIVLSRRDMQTGGARYSQTTALDEQYESFLGFLEVQALPGTDLLVFSVMQIRIRFRRQDYLMVYETGADDNTFLSSMGMRLAVVFDLADPAQRSVYANLHFTLNADGLRPDPTDGLVQSLRIGVGARQGSVAWTSPCEQAVAPDFLRRVQQPACGPNVSMCTPSLIGRYHPRMPFISTVGVGVSCARTCCAGLDSCADFELRGCFWSYCSEQQSYLSCVDYVDRAELVVGFGRTRDELRSRTVLLPVCEPESSLTQRSYSRSVESGLLTLALQAKDTYLLEIVDLITVHITGDLFEQVMAVLSGQGAGVQVDEAGGSSLKPSDALTRLCSSSAVGLRIGNYCVLRYAIRGGEPVPGLAHEVLPGQAAAAAAFVRQTIGESDHLASLGANFSDLLCTEYQLGGRTKPGRAWWISQGIYWDSPNATGSARFSLSQKVAVVALVHLVSGGVRRSTVLSSVYSPASSGSSVARAVLDFGGSSGQLVAEQLGLNESTVSVWRLRLMLKAEDASMEQDKRESAVLQRIYGILDDTASPVASVANMTSSISERVSGGYIGEFKLAIVFKVSPSERLAQVSARVTDRWLRVQSVKLTEGSGV